MPRSMHFLKYQYNKNSWLGPFSKKKKNLLNVPGISVITSSSQVTSELYNGASKGSNHIEQQMLWNDYSKSLPKPPIALWFPWSNLWPTLSLHQLHYDYINPKDALTSPLLQFFWILTLPHTPHILPPCIHIMLFRVLSTAGLFQKCICTKITSLIYSELLPNSLVLVLSAFVPPSIFQQLSF